MKEKGRRRKRETKVMQGKKATSTRDSNAQKIGRKRDKKEQEKKEGQSKRGKKRTKQTRQRQENKSKDKAESEQRTMIRERHRVTIETKRKIRKKR